MLGYSELQHTFPVDGKYHSLADDPRRNFYNRTGEHLPWALTTWGAMAYMIRPRRVLATLRQNYFQESTGKYNVLRLGANGERWTSDTAVTDWVIWAHHTGGNRTIRMPFEKDLAPLTGYATAVAGDFQQAARPRPCASAVCPPTAQGLRLRDPPISRRIIRPMGVGGSRAQGTRVASLLPCGWAGSSIHVLGHPRCWRNCPCALPCLPPTGTRVKLRARQPAWWWR